MLISANREQGTMVSETPPNATKHSNFVKGVAAHRAASPAEHENKTMHQ